MRKRWLVVPLTLVALSLVAAQGFKPEGEKIPIPGTTDCFIYVTTWENGSWLDPKSPPNNPQLRQGKTSNTEKSRDDVSEVSRWLRQLLEQSPDMVEKSKTACELSGVKYIQIALVRDDPKAGPGTAFFTTPVVVVDVGDTEKLVTTGKAPNA